MKPNVPDLLFAHKMASVEHTMASTKGPQKRSSKPGLPAVFPPIEVKGTFKKQSEYHRPVMNADFIMTSSFEPFSVRIFSKGTDDDWYKIEGWNCSHPARSKQTLLKLAPETNTGIPPVYGSIRDSMRVVLGNLVLKDGVWKQRTEDYSVHPNREDTEYHDVFEMFLSFAFLMSMSSGKGRNMIYHLFEKLKPDFHPDDFRFIAVENIGGERFNLYLSGEIHFNLENAFAENPSGYLLESLHEPTREPTIEPSNSGIGKTSGSDHHDGSLSGSSVANSGRSSPGSHDAKSGSGTNDSLHSGGRFWRPRKRFRYDGGSAESTSSCSDELHAHQKDEKMANIIKHTVPDIIVQHFARKEKSTLVLMNVTVKSGMKLELPKALDQLRYGMLPVLMKQKIALGLVICAGEAIITRLILDEEKKAISSQYSFVYSFTTDGSDAFNFVEFDEMCLDIIKYCRTIISKP